MHATNMNDLLRRALPILGICIAALAALTGCGPGSGGTGTGAPEMFSAPAIAGSGGTTGGSGTGQPDAQLDISATTIELRARCGQIVFDAQAVNLAPDANIAGTVTSAGTTSPASLHLQFDAQPGSSTQVTITLVDASGRIILGPIVMQRSQATLPSACQ
jgi:hypothetical protein